ncbi:LCP family protein [Patescibacteria group bacterium]|nr:LCP family protein [Patescibacteria group bacterium]
MTIKKRHSIFLIIFVVLFLFFLSFYRFYRQPIDNFLSALKNNSYQDASQVNFLLLGLDPRDDLLEKTNTTDTIIFASLKFSPPTLSLVSLPRDLWSYPLAKKINQIYPLSLEKDNSFIFIKDNFSQLLNQNIDHVFIISTQNLIDLVELIGGLDVYLDQAFTDSQFPNPDYIKDPSADLPIYITISFNQGLNHLDSQNVTYFVRSRHSASSAAAGGTDIGRSQRQQILLEALLTKIKSGQIKPQQIVSLYRYFNQNIKTDFSDQQLFSLALRLKKKALSLDLKKIAIPTGENPKTGILYYPGYLYQGQWVFLPQDKEYRSLQQFISDHL